jgi:hypothetical protein
MRRPARRAVRAARILGWCLAGGVSLSVGAPPARAQGRGLPPSALERADSLGRYTTIWRADAAPVSYEEAAPTLRGRRVPVAPGVTLERLQLRGSGEARWTELVVVRLAPGVVRFALDTAFDHGRRHWTLERASPRALLAVNAGQFEADLPWGGVRLDGHDWLPAGRGPLVSTVTVDSAGRLTLAHGGGALPAWARWGFQSYPTLLAGGEVPAPLRASGLGLDVAHRDARLAIGTTVDGTLVVAMTRFVGLGERLGLLPFGLTTPEMAAVMGLLGARDAVLLDGGISAQLQVRLPGGRTARWPGLRAVPLALVAYRIGVNERAK